MKKGLIAGILLMSCLSGCGGAPRDSLKASNLAKEVEHIMNLRYSGYVESDNEELESLLGESLASEIKDRFKASESSFMSLEDIISKMENDVVLEETDSGEIVETNLNNGYTDARIYKNESGERGIDIDDVYIEGGRFSIEILGNTITVDVPEGLELRHYRGNPSYKLSLMEYNLYDDGTFIVSLGTDLEGAFKDKYKGLEVVPEGEEQEISGDIESLDGTQSLKVTDKMYSDIYNTFMYSYDSYESKVMMKVGKDGKISELSIDKILGELKSDE